MAQYKLVSFSTCPFVQRAVILLKEKNIPFEIEYIDLANKPEWFLKISPRGKVPVLQVDGKHSLFESQAIVEYLDETTDGPLLSQDPIQRARDRAWFALISEDLFMNQYRLGAAKEAEKAQRAWDSIQKALGRMEEELGQREYLNGNGKYGLADIAAAPFLFRAELHKKWGWLDTLKGKPNLAAWSERVLAREAVKKSVREDFEQEERGYRESAGAWIVSNGKSLNG